MLSWKQNIAAGVIVSLFQTSVWALAWTLTSICLGLRRKIHIKVKFSKDVTALDGKWDLYHLDGVLASQYQSSDWNQHTT